MKKKRRISLSLTIVAPVLLGVLALQGVAIFFAHKAARDADYNDCVANDKVQLLAARMVMPSNAQAAVDAIKTVYEANPIEAWPTTQEGVRAYQNLYSDVMESQEYTDFANSFPTSLLGDYADYIRVGFFDQAKSRFVTVLCQANGSVYNVSFPGSFDTMDPGQLVNGSFYGITWRDEKRNTDYLISGTSIKPADPFNGWWIVRSTKLESLYSVSDDFMRRYIWIGGASFAGMAVLSFIGIQFGLLRPIKKLSRRSDAYVSTMQEGSLSDSFELDRKPFANEISTLNDSLFYMQESMKDYSEQIKEAAVREQKAAADLAFAEKIQASMVPSKPLLGEKVTFYGKMIPAKEVGGDFFSYFPVDDDHYGFYIGDVSGKGVPAALFMARAASVARLLIGELDVDRINAVLCKDNNEDLFVTGFFGVVDTKKNVLHYVNCGHEPVFFRHKGIYAPLEEERNLPIGCIEDFSYKKQSIPVEEGDALFLYTDGLSEAMDVDGNLFGKERILETLNKYALFPGFALFGAMDQEVKGFVKDAEQSDDTCYVHVGFAKQESIDYAPTMEGLSEVSAFVENTLSPLFDAAVIHPLLVMVDELCCNVVRYSKATKASLTLSYGPKTIHMTLVDDGVPFDPTHTKVEKDLDEEGGLGILMVSALCEAMSYARAKEENILVLQAKTNK
ncbi:MAG: hypothetical protein E7179_01725 [Erysipelotrichaceae bacterium]|jgi:serine phosphatase RsbU (regulator of sigma subunit)/anti-sigma regulatory factor (Ser/Thr protein kinase)|nr:hypothetical protein [Erysipelotrichaceae bacterium]